MKTRIASFAAALAVAWVPAVLRPEGNCDGVHGRFGRLGRRVRAGSCVRRSAWGGRGDWL